MLSPPESLPVDEVMPFGRARSIRCVRSEQQPREADGMTRTDEPAVAGARAADDPPASPVRRTGRLRSVDVARGLVVGLSAVLSHIPDPSYTFARHAEWHGITMLDLILPAFLCLFGTGISLAYRRGVRWRRLARRTVLLLVIGLLFNAVVAWEPDPSLLRFTGVLQLFAVVGLAVTLLTRAARAWWAALLAAAAVLAVMQVSLLVFGAECAGGAVEPGCTPSSLVDPTVFGQGRLYRGGEPGYDPEGIPVMFGATATVLLGYAAGELLWRRRGSGASGILLALSGVLVAATPLLAAGVPINKRVWSPAYAVLTAAATVLLLAFCHLLVDRLPHRRPATERAVAAATWLPEAFGRNSLLVYFGKYLVAAVLANVAVMRVTGDQPIDEWLYSGLSVFASRPAMAYSAVMFTAWAIVAAVLHDRGRYLRV